MTTGKNIDGAYITREQWLLQETRIVANLKFQGLSDSEIIEKAKAENIFCYRTERSLASTARACLRRIDAAKSEELTRVLTDGIPEAAAQANLYFMMCTYPLVRDFMMNEIARRYEELNYTLTRTDMNAYITRLESEYDNIAGASEKTLDKIKQVLRKCLVECGMLATSRNEDLIPIFMDFEVRAAIERKGDTEALAAFNCRGMM